MKKSHVSKKVRKEQTKTRKDKVTARKVKHGYYS
jgi:hypothetical protein